MTDPAIDQVNAAQAKVCHEQGLTDKEGGENYTEAAEAVTDVGENYGYAGGSVDSKLLVRRDITGERLFDIRNPL